MEALTKKISYKEFTEMEIPEGDTSIYELINGEIVKRASHNTRHQRASFRLTLEFGNYNLEAPPKSGKLH